MGLFVEGVFSKEVCHCEPVVLRAANQNLNDCQWQSYLNVAHTGVAPSRDSLRSQSVFQSLPLGWCSAQRIKILMTASGSHTLM